MIDVTGVDLVKLAQKAYELSSPQGMGFLHFAPGGLTEEEAQSLVNKDDRWGPLSMDYVRGRSIKLHVRRDNGKLVLPDSWYDHTDSQYKELLEEVGVEISKAPKDHSVACNCIECQRKRPVVLGTEDVNLI